MANVINQKSIAWGLCKPCGNKMRMGFLEKGSPTVSAEGLQVGRVSDTVRAVCGHSGTIISGSVMTFANMMPVATTNSRFEGAYSGRFLNGAVTVSAN
jgi:hypothetical protein